MPAFLDVPVSGAYHLVLWIAQTFEPVTGPYAAALAIVVCTVAVRLALLPLSIRAARGTKSRTALLPQLKELSERHKGDPERLNREIAALQAESGSLFAGCLPLLAQLPFFWLMYRLFSTAVVAGQSNQLLTGTLFGAPLGLHWPLLTSTPVYLGLAVLLAVVAYFSSRWQRRTADTQPAGLAGHLTRVLPYGTLATAAFIPLAAGLYLLTTTTWTVAERMLLQR
ncbi:YidC/Oxa1 family membrane protein insertase [Kribbella monticola]|uniref:YidC/Oxa1 family membrane protein insertase n=1 Tax=Kribbella monticola TaxID=2185285 RepID=UPI000DD44B31|nr:YidC/Oxa1 family membrane protein insertase [Kribbella monticola]